jgi:[ribosomal protein S5]-alanine N-acetyltransferase
MRNSAVDLDVRGVMSLSRAEDARRWPEKSVRKGAVIYGNPKTMTRTDRLVAIQLSKAEFFEYIKDRVTTQSERAYIDSIMIPGMLSGKEPMYYTFFVGVDTEKELIVCELCFKGEPDNKGNVEIGGSTMPAFRNKGYMSEMIKHMVNIARGTKKIKKVVAIVDENNNFSKKAVVRNNFKQQSGIVWTKKVK